MAVRHMLFWLCYCPDLHKLTLRREAHRLVSHQVDAVVVMMHAAVGRTRRAGVPRRAIAKV